MDQFSWVNKAHHHKKWRHIRASLRDTWLLLREFSTPLVLFVLAIIGSGCLFYVLAFQAGEPLNDLPQAFYLTLSLTFLQSTIDFPKVWYLEIFFFLMPVIGLSILAQGLTDFGVMLFNRRLRGKEWEMAVASTYNNHHILVGLGHLGYRVAQTLYSMEQELVVIERGAEDDLINNVRSWGIPVINDDATRQAILESAGVQKARTILLCTQNDSLNLQIALKARSINPKIEVVLRIFDEDFAQALSKQFGFHALSANGMAAPIFAAAAANIDMTAPINILGQLSSLARIEVNNTSKLYEQSINDIENQYQVSLVMLCRDGEVYNHPDNQIILKSGDLVAVLGSPRQINKIMHGNLL
jgi:Trk K+ transport system NAD-binding subunit